MVRALGFVILGVLAVPVGVAILVGWVALAVVWIVADAARRLFLKMWRA